MKNNKMIVALIAALTLVAAVHYTLSQLDAGGPGPRGGQGPAAAAPLQGQPPQTDAATIPAPQGRPTQAPGPGGQAEPAPAAGHSELAEVGVVKVTAADYRARVKGYGEASPRHSLTLSAQVGGQVTSLAEHFETGARVKQGESLARIDDTDYQQALAAAQTSYQEAVVALEEERLQGQQAKDEWARSGLSGEPASALVFREPQLKSAQAALKEAQQDVAAAKRDLAATRITAPFDALVVSRNIQPGSFVQQGTEIASLYSSNVAEISIPLSPDQWSRLPAMETGTTPGWAVTLRDAAGSGQWQARIARAELHQDKETRQRNVIAVVEQPLSLPSPLLFGTFLVAEIEGRELHQVWRIPSSAISQQLEVWYVNPDDNLLGKFTPEVLFEYEGHAYITPHAGMTEAMIVARPLNNYLVNTRVNPVNEGEQS